MMDDGTSPAGAYFRSAGGSSLLLHVVLEHALGVVEGGIDSGVGSSCSRRAAGSRDDQLAPRDREIDPDAIVIPVRLVPVRRLIVT